MDSKKARPKEFRQELVEQCLDTIARGTPKQLYNFLPQISILRDPRLLHPLVQLLRVGDRPRREFAALALGTLQDPRALKPLFEAFTRRENLHGRGSQALQTAILVALGGLGTDEAVNYLVKLYDFTFKGDRFFKKRRCLILSSLGEIAQQGNNRAQSTLIGFLGDEEPQVRAQAVVELSTAYWHRPNELSEELIARLIMLMRDRKSVVRQAAFSSLMNLADLGCKSCEEFFRQPA